MARRGPPGPRPSLVLDRWTARPPIPRPCGDAGALAHDGTLYIFGGGTDEDDDARRRQQLDE